MSLTLPQVIGGDAPLTYALTPVLPEGLNFDAETRVHCLVHRSRR